MLAHHRFLLTLLFFVSLLNDICIATTYTASSCSYSDVLSAYNSASDGDAVIIPSGSCTWASQLVISKAITLKGQGISSTIITHGYSGSLIKISPGSDKAIRITDIYFKSSTNDSGYTTVYIDGDTTGTYALTKVRIDHCKIEKGSRAIHAVGWVEGLIDNNQFINCNIAIGITGDNDYSWRRPIKPGTANALFIEDNSFIINNEADREPNEQIYLQEGGRIVVRYNRFDGTDYTSGDYLIFDSHGNWGTPITQYRGQPIIEFYSNTIEADHTYRLMNIRGGSVLVYNNSFTLSTGSANIELHEEEGWTSSGPWNGNPPTTEWPAKDQIFNSFFWNNKLNGSLVDPVEGTNGYEDDILTINKDYFLHEPQSSGGYETWIGDPGSGTLVWNASGANACYPYTPYEYPHPLRGIRTLKGISFSGGISTQ